MCSGKPSSGGSGWRLPRGEKREQEQGARLSRPRPAGMPRGGSVASSLLPCSCSRRVLGALQCSPLSVRTCLRVSLMAIFLKN